MKEHATGKSNAKIILIGEHSVVYGQPAIAVPLTSIQTVARVSVLDSDEARINSRFFTGPVDQLPVSMKGVAKLLNALVQSLNLQGQGWLLDIQSKIPAERGMGSSAAVAVAITRAFYNLAERALDHNHLLQLADIEEQITHRNPSGLDAATSSVTTPLWYIKHQTSQPLDMQLNATMVIADTGVKGATKDAIDGVSQQLDTNPHQANHLIQDLGKLASTARVYLAADEPVKLGAVLNQSQQDLAQLTVSSPQLDHLCSVAINNGAYGAKLTGGGRGGCMYALVKNFSAGQKLAAQLIAAGAVQTWVQRFGNGGQKR